MTTTMTKESVQQFVALIEFLMFRDFFFGQTENQYDEEEKALKAAFPEETEKIVICNFDERIIDVSTSAAKDVFEWEID